MREFLGLSSISPRIRRLLQKIGEFGEQASRSVYVVGGFVRDLLIGRENLDLDIVLEGDAIPFASQLAEAWAGEVQVHRKFGTATVTRPDALKIDFVSARNETYPRPGALPSVKYGTIAADLRRRDFSINALAMRLNPGHFGELVNCMDGLRDLRAGRIRALHDRSFIDDPTRIFRAIRYEGRYGFQIVEGDQRYIHDAICQGVLNLISGQRIRNEIDRILLEEAVPRMVHRMREFNLFRAIHPAWEISPNFDALWTAAGQAIKWASTYLPNDQINTSAIRWMTLLTDSSPTSPLAPLLKGEGEESGGEAPPSHLLPSPRRGGVGGEVYTIEVVSDRLALENQLQAKLIAKEQLWRVLDRLSASSKPSEVYQLLNPYPLESLVFALTQPDQPDWRVEKIEVYLTHLKDIQPLITGDDLIRQGLKPGRAFAALLQKAFAAQLDGKISTKQELTNFWSIEDDG